MGLSKRSLLFAGACALVGCVVASLLLASMDLQFAHADGAVDVTSTTRWIARARLLSVAGGALGLAAALVTMVAALIHRVWPSIRLVIICGVAFSAAGLAHEPVAITLRGFAERQPENARLLFMAAVFGITAVAGAVAALSWHSIRGFARGRARFGATVIVVLAGAAVVAAWGDLTILVALYASAHALAEVSAWLLGAVACSLVCCWLGQRVRFAPHVIVAMAAAALLWSAAWLRDDKDSYEIDKVLALSKRQQGYATRMRLRAQTVRDYMRDPANWQGARAARMDRLKQRYDIVSTELAPKWDLPRKGAGTKYESPRAGEKLNVVVLFIDTLRADVAIDSSVMPNLAKLRARSLSFENAYSTASDTISALPVLTGGCYGQSPCAGDVLRLAHDNGVTTAVVMAKSARRFLAKHAPHFAFDEVVEVVDYAEGKKVWGYGADQTSASRVTQQSLAWLAKVPRDQRFLLWSFHFDVHNWMQLDRTHLNEQARKHGIVKDAKRWRYRAAAAGVDQAVGELIAGLQAQGRDKDTAILIVSDHGEGLGRNGHWQHAVYLWDALVKVPMMLYIPGVAPAQYSRPVGHVDVAPTLAQLLELGADMRRYHGVPLFSDSAEHDLPLLLFSMRKNDLLRIGVVSREQPPLKLELPINSAEPEVYEADGTDTADVQDRYAGRTLTLLSELVTSPMFPRPAAVKEAGDNPARSSH